MNHVLSKTKQRSLLLVALLLMGCLQLFAQTRTIKGEVTDAQMVILLSALPLW